VKHPGRKGGGDVPARSGHFLAREARHDHEHARESPGLAFSQSNLPLAEDTIRWIKECEGHSRRLDPLEGGGHDCYGREKCKYPQRHYNLVGKKLVPRVFFSRIPAEDSESSFRKCKGADARGIEAD